MTSDVARKRAIVFQHDDDITLGNLEPVLEEHGYDIHIVDVATADVSALDPEDGELVIVLGGEKGAYQVEEYPHLADEMRFIRARVEANKPTFGVCLGAQLMAGAFGARNYKGDKPDLGYQDIQLTEAGLASPLRHIQGVGMLVWHSDHYTLPEEATLLGTSTAYPNEAYSIGDYALAVQFHPEVTDEMHEAWTLGSRELFETNNVDADEWRELGRIHNPPMEAASRLMFGEWLATLPR